MMVQVGGIIFRLYDCDPQRLSSPAIVWRLLRGAARESWTARRADGIARLPSGGISGFVRSREIQISIHTRPLQRYAEISLSLCDRRDAPEAMGVFFAQGLGSSCLRTIDA
jgi:S-adenosylmethionine/arginine decarboxylase-like enzyme